MTKRITTGFVAAALVGVVLCGANPASALIFESFDNWGTPPAGWTLTGTVHPTSTASADGNSPTHGTAFAAWTPSYTGGGAIFVAADAGVDISEGFYFDHYNSSSDSGGGTYLPLTTANSGNIGEIILSSNGVYIETSQTGGKLLVHSYSNPQSTDWRRIEVIPDYTANTLMVRVDGVDSLTAPPSGTLTALTGFKLNGYAAHTNIGLDRMGAIPEPATAALLCFGTALMVRRRR
ncbi:MAG: hypothetical protein CMJ18_21920 [Phycisphaeraceae bacterium]|nr:hypothetical protein [Phycisphaeraceae bacterium]